MGRIIWSTTHTMLGIEWVCTKKWLSSLLLSLLIVYHLFFYPSHEGKSYKDSSKKYFFVKGFFISINIFFSFSDGVSILAGLLQFHFFQVHTKVLIYSFFNILFKGLQLTYWCLSIMTRTLTQWYSEKNQSYIIESLNFMSCYIRWTTQLGKALHISKAQFLQT